MNWSSDNHGRNNARKASWMIGCEESTRGPWKTLPTRQGLPAMHAFESLEFPGSSFLKQGKYKISHHLKAHEIHNYHITALRSTKVLANLELGSQKSI